MFPKVESTVDARDKRISDDLEAEKAASARADEIEEEYRIQNGEDRAAAQKIKQLAKEKAAKSAERRLADADAKISEKIGAVETEIAAATASAMTEIEVIAAEEEPELVAKLSDR